MEKHTNVRKRIENKETKGKKDQKNRKTEKYINDVLYVFKRKYGENRERGTKWK